MFCLQIDGGDAGKFKGMEICRRSSKHNVVVFYKNLLNAAQKNVLNIAHKRVIPI